ncbi:cytochrome P450 [Lactarius indigo]|nr:cytochrome P450 [Lactarius indigo]
MGSAAVYLASVILASLFFAVFVRFNGRKSPLPYPPGPRGLPFIGNALDIPPSHPWETFYNWGKKWGALTHLTLFGQHYLVINSFDTAVKMLDAKSTIYSDRPSFLVLGDMMGWKDGVAVATYGERLRDLRRLLHQVMGTPASVTKLIPVIEREVHRFLQRLLDAPPDEFAKNLRSAVNAATLDFTYGYKVHGLDDPLIKLTELASKQFARASMLGSFVVDILPFLRHVPDWFPGTGWKQLGREWGENVRALVDIPFELVRDRRAAGVSVPSFTDQNFTEGMTEHQEDLVKWAANAITMGGTDTTVSSVTTFFLAMTLYPEIQRKAQEELDAVVGTHRLPTIDDRDKLPYLNALLKEVLRWGPATPLGLLRPGRMSPALLTASRRSLSWSPPSDKGRRTRRILHTRGNYHSRQRLGDDARRKRLLQIHRFLTLNDSIASETKPAEADPRACFGFGRRCAETQSVRVAEGSLFLYFATTLSTYQITKAVDESGAILEPKVQYTSFLMSHPMPFPFTIKPRSEQAAALIRSLPVADSE